MEMTKNNNKQINDAIRQKSRTTTTQKGVDCVVSIPKEGKQANEFIRKKARRA
jgi:hypothetical protein